MSNPDFEMPYTSYTPGASKAGVGRVNLNTGGQNAASAYDSVFQHRTGIDTNMQNDALRGNWEQTPLSAAFFSLANFSRIQKAIKAEVYKRSGDKKWIIDDQSADEMQIIMRAIYLQYAKNLPTNIEGQIAELNAIVVEWAVPKIMSEIQQHFYYLRDISEMPKQMAHPVSVSSAGTKSFDLTKFF
jgi:hypothetical protein